MAQTTQRFTFDVIDVHTHIGRLPGHVHYAYTTLSRTNAQLACDRGEWWVSNLAKGPIAKGRPGEPRVRIEKRARLLTGDVITIGPLQVRFEIPAGAVQDEAPMVRPTNAARHLVRYSSPNA